LQTDAQVFASFCGRALVGDSQTISPNGSSLCCRRLRAGSNDTPNHRPARYLNDGNDKERTRSPMGERVDGRLQTLYGPALPWKHA